MNGIPTVLVVPLFGSLLLGLLLGSLGSLAYLRKQSLTGDVVSHSVLPGICLSFLFLGSEVYWLYLGAGLSGFLALQAASQLQRFTKLKMDAVLAVILSCFFGMGTVLLVYLQKNYAEASKAGIDRFLWGQAATLLRQDCVIAGLTIAVLFYILLAIYKPFQLYLFDPTQLQVQLGYPRFYELFSNLSLVCVIVVGVQAVGVVLMSAMMITPALCVRPWVKRLPTFFVCSGLTGALLSVAGTLISFYSADFDANLPSGPVIVGLSLLALVFTRLANAVFKGISRP